jgi:hypothetical protein
MTRIALLAAAAAPLLAMQAATIPFTHAVVDANNPADPHCKAVGDVNGDGFPDVIVASSSNGGMYWYEYPAWTKRAIRASGSWTTDMQAGDVDGDGDLDLILPNASGLLWYKNPRPSGNPANGSEWTEFNIGPQGANNHDVEVGDLNRDGKLDVVTRPKGGGATHVWLQNSPTSWTRVQATSRSGEGTGLGDIDNDGDLDILHNGFWVENTNGAGTAWAEHTISTNWPADVGAAVADLNGDGRKDVILAPSESSGRLSWYESATPRTGPWTEHVVDSTVSYIHTFKAADVDNDGDLDLVTAEMHQSGDPDEVSVYRNGGNGLSWTQQVVATSGSHNVRVGDIDKDGDLDIMGTNWNESAPNSAVVEIWRNGLNPRGSLDSWARRVIDASRPWTALFIASGDIDRDGKQDVVTGGWWYRNPGSTTGTWTRNAIGSPLNNMAAVYDFDGDGDLDVLGTQGQGSQSNNQFVWARNNGSGAFTILTNIQTGGSGDFLQGVAVARFTGGGPLEVALSWHNGGGGVQMLTVPAAPSTGTWTWRTISTTSQDEQLSAGDIDRDGDSDLLLGTKWLRNDGASWSVQTLFSTSSAPDRNRLADLNRDGRLDAVVGYEAISTSGKLAWYEQGASATAAWAERVIATVVGPMSLDVADMDGDGDLDVVVGEHNLSSPSAARLLVFENTDGRGGAWAPHVVYTGDEHHDGAQVADIDGDGDKDILSIGWGHPRVVLYENTSSGGPPPPPPPPPPGDGTGVTGEYYDAMDLTGLVFTRTDASINNAWGTGSPDPLIGPDTFSVRWTGRIQARYSEPTTFITRSDDGVRLWVNGQKLVDNWTDHGPTENSGTIALQAGQLYDFTLEYYENGGGAVIELSWQSASQAREIVPRGQLHLRDADGDGMADAGETAAGLDPADGDQDGNGRPDGQDDWDGDGIDNATELANGVSPGAPGGGGGGGGGGGSDGGGCGALGLEAVALFLIRRRRP